MYYRRNIDLHLKEWANRKDRKPLLLRGARQVGKSTAVQHLGKDFQYYVEINFEKSPSYKDLFRQDLDVQRIVPLMAAMHGTPIIPGKTLLFLDEIQDCQEAIMALRYFKEDMPQLHVIAAGSLLEFALEEIPTFGVSRIHSMYMHPMTFDEFLLASGKKLLLDVRRSSSANTPLPEPIYKELIRLIRIYILIGGMPEVVAKWIETSDFLQCLEIQDDIISGYQDDFPKYRKKIDPVLLSNTMTSVAMQATKKFVYSRVEGNYRSAEVKKALALLTTAGIIIPVTHTDASGLPLGDNSDTSIQKYLLLDTGLLLRMLSISMGNSTELTTQILTANEAELVNKGTVAEMLAGLELLRNMTPNIRHKMYYWVKQNKNSVAEIDYLLQSNMHILPIEVKAETQGGMKSLWDYMRQKKLHQAIRCSLENFGSFDYIDPTPDKNDTSNIRHVTIWPLYAISQMDSWNMEVFRKQ